MHSDVLCLIFKVWKYSQNILPFIRWWTVVIGFLQLQSQSKWILLGLWRSGFRVVYLKFWYFWHNFVIWSCLHYLRVFLPVTWVVVNRLDFLLYFVVYLVNTVLNATYLREWETNISDYSVVFVREDWIWDISSLTLFCHLRTAFKTTPFCTRVCNFKVINYFAFYSQVYHKVAIEVNIINGAEFQN